MANLTTVAAPPPSEDGSDDPSPDSNPATGIHRTEAPAAGVELAEPIESDFVLDSVTVEHATGNQSSLSAVRDLRAGEPSSITRRDGEILPAASVGLVQQGDRFCLDRVLYVPGLPPASTLVSVHQLTRRGLSVSFCGASCVVADRSTGTLVGEGRMRDEDGFYHLDYLRVPIP